MDIADIAEAESIRRFKQMSELCRAINEAARRAAAQARLESALRYEVRSPATPHRAA